MRSVAVAVVLLALLAMSPAYGQTLVGRWCDRMVPNLPNLNSIITIVINAQNEPEAHTKFYDSSTAIKKLREVSGNIFSVLDSSSGDKYRISGSTGELQLIDNDGLIRVASRLGNAPQAGECK